MTQPGTRAPVTIAGGGIGGLALALALARHGLPSRVLERQAAFAEAGAGIQIGPNGTRLLEWLGAARHLEPLAGTPEAIRVRDGRSGARLADLPLGPWIAARHGAPYWVAHRADLQAALLQAARAHGTIEIVPGFEVTGVSEDADGVTVAAADGRRVEGAVLIGADGLWSTLRARVLGAPPLAFSGKTATRTVLRERPPPLDGNVTGVWLSPDAHVVHYPVRGGAETAVVVIADEDWQGLGWAAPDDAGRVMARLSGFHQSLRDALAVAPEWRRWALFDPPPLARWCRGRIGLLGDAAHPVLPFLAQGGVLALEDAMVLAAELARVPGDPASALIAYETARRPRAARVQLASRRNGRIYHLAGATGRARDLALRLVPGARLMAGYDWLYGWRANERGTGA